MLKKLFVSEVRLNILKTMLPNPEKPLHVRGIVRAVGTEINAVRRELKKLEEVGLLKKRKSSNRIYYAVDTSCIIYPELLSLIAKEEGIGAEIIKNRRELGDVKFAVLSRRFSRNVPATTLDVDLFVVGSVNFPVLESLVNKYQNELKREINYTVMGEEEFKFRKRKNDQFVSKVLSQGRTMLIGDEYEFWSIQ